MELSHLKTRIRVAWTIAIGLTAIASALFAAQRGFGAGHGRFDLVIWLLGLPWVLVPRPKTFMTHDYVWLVVLPCVLNMATIAIFGVVLRSLPRWRRK